MVAARHRDQPAGRNDEELGQLARLLDGNPLVALGVEQQQRDRQRPDRRVQVVRRQHPLERRHVGVERELPRGQAAAEPFAARRADRDDRPGARERRGEDRQVAAHARPAQRDRRFRVADPLAQQAGDRRDVIERAVVHRPGAVAVPALVERDGAEPRRQRGAREVVMVLLARAGAVEDHDPARAGRRAATASTRARHASRSRSVARG